MIREEGFAGLEFVQTSAVRRDLSVPPEGCWHILNRGMPVTPCFAAGPAILSRAEGVLMLKTLTTISRFGLLCPVLISSKKRKDLMSFRKR
jgi:hypothetical protein